MILEYVKKLAAELFELTVSITPEQAQNSITLLSGDTPWNVDIGGKTSVWNLAYPDSSSLPISNTDYFKFVNYNGNYYRIKRAFSDVIWLTGKAIVSTQKEK